VCVRKGLTGVPPCLRGVGCGRSHTLPTRSQSTGLLTHTWHADSAARPAAAASRVATSTRSVECTGATQGRGWASAQQEARQTVLVWFPLAPTCTGAPTECLHLHHRTTFLQQVSVASSARHTSKPAALCRFVWWSWPSSATPVPAAPAFADAAGCVTHTTRTPGRDSHRRQARSTTL
jgi:hypothetical protein